MSLACTSIQPRSQDETIFDAATREAHAYLDGEYETVFVPPFFEGTHWAVPGKMEVVEGMSSSFAEPNSYPIDGRGAAYSMGYFSVKHMGSGQFYLMAIDDNSGEALSGKKNYRLHVPPNVPVRLYWSATAYPIACRSQKAGTTSYACTAREKKFSREPGNSPKSNR